MTLVEREQQLAAQLPGQTQIDALRRRPPRTARPLPELGPQRTAPTGRYTVAPDVAAVVIEAGRQLGAPVRAGARSPAAFERALARLIMLADLEAACRKYETLSADV